METKDPKERWTEDQTRAKQIDTHLERVKWKRSMWEEEINTVKSRFNIKENINEYVPKPKNPKEIEKGVDHFADYILKDTQGYPLAIVEAKKYSKSQKEGYSQAITYNEDIRRQIKEGLPIFLTNGRKWEYVDLHGNKREVYGPFSQQDLERRRFLFHSEKDPRQINLNPNIDRKKSAEILKELAKWFSKDEKCRRYALIEMATGTGKTFVAMGLIDLLKKANYVQNVLFIVDRIALADQAAEEGFVTFFGENEPITKLHREGFSTSPTLYSSTLQTMMKNKFFKKFSPGFFDMIIFDEAHRSILGFKPKELIEYFDAIKIGLTATPKDLEEQSTYELFECNNHAPTVEYSFEEAVDDKVLVDSQSKTIFLKTPSRGVQGKKLSAYDKDKLRKQEEDPEKWEVTGKQYYRKYVNKDTNRMIIKKFLEWCYYAPDTLPCKTIFFCMCQKHAEDLEDLFHKEHGKIASYCKTIISDYSHAQQDIRRFKNVSSPRIAFSVGMLDTGVNIPQVCNLVFIKPVMSHIRFWQMFGRATRNFKACRKHIEWLPLNEQGEPKKDDFKIMDFAIGGWNNIKEHKIKIGKEKEVEQPPAVKIFADRVQLLRSNLSDEQRDLMIKKIIEDIEQLDQESIFVREKVDTINEIESNFNKDEHIESLTKEILPLMRYREGEDAKVAMFRLQVVKLYDSILKEDNQKIAKIKEIVKKKLKNVWEQDNITEVRLKQDEIAKVLSEDYWYQLTFEKVENLESNLAPLMKYYLPPKGKIVEIDVPEVVILEIQETKKDPDIRAFLFKDPFIIKIKQNKEITTKELSEFASRLVKINPTLTVDNIRRTEKDIMDFIYRMINLTHKEDSRKIVLQEFQKKIVQAYDYNEKQLKILEMIGKFLADRKFIKLKDFTVEPLDKAYDYFEEKEIQWLVKECNDIKFK